jgi:hypothetical protein
MKIYINDSLRIQNAKASIKTPFYMFDSEINGDPPKFIIEEAIEYFKHSLLDDDVVILTSSEHVILVLMKLIRQRFIECEDIHLYFHDSEKWIMIGLDSDGELLEECPNGFFEERMELIT